MGTGTTMLQTVRPIRNGRFAPVGAVGDAGIGGTFLCAASGLSSPALLLESGAILPLTTEPGLVEKVGSLVTSRHRGGIAAGVGAYGESAFVWTESEGLEQLPLLPGTTSVALRSIADDGTVCGSLRVGDQSIAAVWTPELEIVQLPTPAASAVGYHSSEGSVVGLTDEGHPYRWTAGGDLQIRTDLRVDVMHSLGDDRVVMEKRIDGSSMLSVGTVESEWSPIAMSADRCRVTTSNQSGEFLTVGAAAHGLVYQAWCDNAFHRLPLGNVPGLNGEVESWTGISNGVVYGCGKDDGGSPIVVMYRLHRPSPVGNVVVGTGVIDSSVAESALVGVADRS